MSKRIPALMAALVFVGLMVFDSMAQNYIYQSYETGKDVVSVYNDGHEINALDYTVGVIDGLSMGIISYKGYDSCVDPRANNAKVARQVIMKMADSEPIMEKRADMAISYVYLKTYGCSREE